MQHFSDAELILKLTQTEDSFVERKSSNDPGGWLKTSVAFANSVPSGRCAVLFLGVSDDGVIAVGTNTERTMQKFSDFLAQHAWPPIKTFPQELTVGGSSCVAVMIPHSAERPHFAGRAYVREGTQTKDASGAQYDAMVASRNGKARQILENIAKDITFLTRGKFGDGYASTRVIIRECNSQYATFDMRLGGEPLHSVTEPLNRLETGWDHKLNRFQIIRYEDR